MKQFLKIHVYKITFAITAILLAVCLVLCMLLYKVHSGDVLYTLPIRYIESSSWNSAQENQTWSLPQGKGHLVLSKNAQDIRGSLSYTSCTNPMVIPNRYLVGGLYVANKIYANNESEFRSICTSAEAMFYDIDNPQVLVKTIDIRKIIQKHYPEKALVGYGFGILLHDGKAYLVASVIDKPKATLTADSDRILIDIDDETTEFFTLEHFLEEWLQISEHDWLTYNHYSDDAWDTTTPFWQYKSLLHGDMLEFTFTEKDTLPEYKAPIVSMIPQWQEIMAQVEKGDVLKLYLYGTTEEEAKELLL